LALFLAILKQAVERVGTAKGEKGGKEGRGKEEEKPKLSFLT
jgi:hypothetical protein